MLYILQTALELGFLYALIPMALFLSFRILNIADMTTDGAFVLGSAVSAMMCLSGHPILALPAGMRTTTASSLRARPAMTRCSRSDDPRGARPRKSCSRRGSRYWGVRSPSM